MYKNSYSVRQSLRELFLQKYERYLPTAFDESMSLLEKMNKLIESQNQLIEAMNVHTEHTSEQIERAFDIVDTNLDIQLKNFRDELEEQKKLYEEIRDKIHSELLPDSVNQKLEEWFLSGRIEDMINNDVFNEYLARIEDVENRVENKELLQEVNIQDYAELVDNGNWQPAIMKALEEAYTVYFPIGEYTTYGIVSSLSNREIKGSGTGTRFKFVRDYDDNRHFHGFQFFGSTEPIKRITENVKPHTNVVTLENADGLEVGDTIVIKSQRNALSYADTGDEWFLGTATSSQKVPFGEYNEVTSIDGNNVTLKKGLIYPSYKSNNADEKDSAQDFSTVQKVNFVENVVLRDFKVTDMNSGTAVRATTCKNMIVDNVHFDHSGYTADSSGTVYFRDSFLCEARNCSFYTRPEVETDRIYDMNVFKIANSQECGFVNCKSENASQTADLTYFSGGVPCTGCYITNCNFVGSTKSGITTHGGNYLTRITDNTITGVPQGIAQRGRGGLIANNTLIGTSKQDTSGSLNCGVNLYEGGCVDNVVSNNTIRNFNTGIGHNDRSPVNARLMFAGTLITDNVISNCNTSININRSYSASRLSPLGIIIANNQIRMFNTPTSSAVRGISLSRGANGVSIGNNVIKGIEGEMIGFVGDRENNFHGIYLEKDVDGVRIFNNTFMDMEYAVNHRGRPADTDFVGRSLNLHRSNNERVRVENNDSIGVGVVQYANES